MGVSFDNSTLLRDFLGLAAAGVLSSYFPRSSATSATAGTKNAATHPAAVMAAGAAAADILGFVAL